MNNEPLSCSHMSFSVCISIANPDYRGKPVVTAFLIVRLYSDEERSRAITRLARAYSSISCTVC